MSKYTFISHSHEYDQVILTSTSITCFFWSVIYFTIDFIFHLYQQIFEDASTFRSTIKSAARTIVDSKHYELQSVEFDEDRFSNQQGWWDHLQSTARELLERSTFLHQGRDETVSGYSDLIFDANSYPRVLQTILIIQDLKNSVFRFTMAAPMLLATYSLTKLGPRFP